MGLSIASFPPVWEFVPAQHGYSLCTADEVQLPLGVLGLVRCTRLSECELKYGQSKKNYKKHEVKEVRCSTFVDCLSWLGQQSGLEEDLGS